MNSQLKQVMRLALLATAVMAGPASAADGDESFNALLEQYQHRPVAAADEWQNAWMSSGTGRYAAKSADEILTATLRIYTRDVLDRGYWVNAWVGDAPGYDSGNPLLAITPGLGVTSRVAGLGVEELPLGAPRAERFGAFLAAWQR
ncbi:hypothetical protein [Piscinibacter sp.]|jgi:hypothetical protein|uniref:hypothetical protein n=1 Tax=Piscinibacter sp. TaxID=1903157 RepID=UPI00355A8DE8